MNCVVLIFLLSALSGQLCWTKGAQTYDDIVASLYYPNKLIFDATKPMSDNLLSEYFKESNPLNGDGTQRPPILYYEPDGAHYDGVAFLRRHKPEASYWERVARHDPLLLHILFDSEIIMQGQHVNWTLPTTTEGIKSFLENSLEKDKSSNVTIIFQVGTLRSVNDYRTIYWYQLLSTMTDIVKDFKLHWNNVKVGLQLDAKSRVPKYYATPPTPELLSFLDVLVLNVNITRDAFLLSYSNFKSDLRQILTHNFDQQVAYPNLTTYVKVSFLPGGRELMSEELYHKYFFYFLQFSVFWLNDGEPEGLILEAFNTTLGSTTGLGGADWRDLVGIDIRDLVKNWSSCQIKTIIGEHISTNFKSISIGLHRPDLDDDDGDDACQFTNLNSSSLPEVNLIFDSDSEYYGDSKKQIISIRDHLLNTLPWRTFTIEFNHGKLDSEPSLKNMIGEPSELPLGVASVCSAVGNTVDSLVTVQLITHDYPSDACSLSLPVSNVIVWETVFSPSHFNLSLNINKLVELEIKLEEYGQVGRAISLSITQSHEHVASSSAAGAGLYCDAKNVGGLQVAEGLIHFAKLHNLPVEWKSIRAFPDRPGGWSRIEPSMIYSLSHQFPVLVARNFPDKFLLGDFHTDPCISWTGTMEAMQGIQIDPEYSGSTVYLDTKMRPLADREVEVLLLFAFNKFSLVEIVPGNPTDMIAVIRVIFGMSPRSHIAIYLLIDCDLFHNGQLDLQFVQLLKPSGSDKLKLTGIHFKHFENCLTVDGLFLDKIRGSGLTVGILLEDCVKEANNLYGSRSSPFLHGVDYVVCNIIQVGDNIEATNMDKDKVEQYFDVAFFLKKYFEKIFRNEQKEIIFHLNVMPVTPYIREFQRTGQFESLFRDQMTEFLKFYSDVNQYASLNKIKMFMFPAFDDMSGSRFGWYRIQNFSNLANASTFIDKEAEYQGRPTWRPPPSTMPDANPVQSEGPTILLLTLVVGVIIFTVAALILRFWFRRRYTLLNKQEVNYFLNGWSERLDLEGAKETEFDSRGFPPEFEIKRDRFILLNLIGKGNFGLVYRTTLSRLDEEVATTSVVAVKIPYPGCSKESFKSMLCELKVLCYVGSHRNVLEFVGACISEIGRGAVYIATELCEHGCLQEYLRKVYSNCSELADGIELKTMRTNLYELYRFAHEVALGMEYISSKEVIHGDLSTRNVLLDTNLVCKIGDFGLSRKLYEYKEYVKTKDGATALPWRWLAIESLKQMTFSTNSDVWSYGVTIWEIFSLGSIPYPGWTWTDKFVEELDSGYRMPAPRFASPKIYEEMRRCWHQTPGERPTFTELGEFFQTIRDNEYVSCGPN